MSADNGCGVIAIALPLPLPLSNRGCRTPRPKASAWEWATNSNVKAARALLQRGLRLNPDSRRLYKQYLRLELLFLEKMILRRQVLGLPTQMRTSQETAQIEAEKKAIQVRSLLVALA